MLENTEALDFFLCMLNFLKCFSFHSVSHCAASGYSLPIGSLKHDLKDVTWGLIFKTQGNKPTKIFEISQLF